MTSWTGWAAVYNGRPVLGTFSASEAEARALFERWNPTTVDGFPPWRVARLWIIEEGAGKPVQELLPFELP